MKSILIFLACIVLISSCKDIETITVKEIPVVKIDNNYYEIHTFNVRCYSDNFEYNECELPQLPQDAEEINIKVIRRYSETLCHIDENYGFYANNIIYVSDGCRALFKVKYEIEIFRNIE